MAAQAQQHAALLACKLVRELHGETVERVCKYMVSKGIQTLPDIVRGTELPPSQVKQALLLLLQQNYCAAFLHRDDTGVKIPRPPYSFYEPRVERMLHILRYPRFLLHIKDEMGEDAERMLEIMLQCGRLTLDQLVSAVAGRLGQDRSECTERTRSVFMSLVQSHYIERAPPCSMPPPLRAPHPASVKGRKGANAKAGSERQAAEQVSALRSLEEISYEKARFKLPQDILLDNAFAGVSGVKREQREDGEHEGEGDGDEDDEPAAPVAKKARTKAGTQSGHKAAAAGLSTTGAIPSLTPAAAAASAAAAAAVANPTVLLWRVNTEEFNRRFRHRTCVDMVGEKIDSDAGNVLAAMLAAARPFEQCLKEERSSALGTDEITDTAARLVEAGVLPRTSAPVPTIISTIAHDALELISYIGNGPGGEQYVVNMARIIQLVQLKQVEAVIRDRFGGSGLRIFRLLLLKGQLEQKQVADFSMLSPKETRELLYRMLRAGFLALQDIPRGSDRAPSRTFYTWRANPDEAGAQLSGELYAGAGRVWARIRHEMAKEKELLELIEESRTTGELNFTLTAAQRAAAQRLKRTVDTLEASLLQLDDMIATFNEF
ncbi:hypothetical protein FOA52_001333 [Chlamydomonas sp. UWO 241]|nr:hypothetical protein FOA52_001333 [Chlamydomonas sp. UWO 241]